MSPDRRVPVNPASLRIIFAGLVGSLVLYVVFAYVVVGQLAGSGTVAMDLPQAFFIAVAVAAVAILLAVPAARRAMRRRSAENAISYATASVVSWAMCESVGVLGVILTVVSHQLLPVAGFAAVALLNMLIYRPTSAAAEAWDAGREPNT